MSTTSPVQIDRWISTIDARSIAVVSVPRQITRHDSAPPIEPYFRPASEALADTGHAWFVCLGVDRDERLDAHPAVLPERPDGHRDCPVG